MGHRIWDKEEKLHMGRSAMDRTFQQESELRIAVMDVSILSRGNINESRDDIAESRQGSVDVGGFLEDSARCRGGLLPL